MVLFADKLRSYRELPLRYAEAAPLHRNEPSGTLHGLTRVRHVTQDDAHIFCTREQIEDEIFACLDYAKWIYDLFDLESKFELSTRPENKLGTDEEWDFTEGALKSALDRRGLEYSINAGDGAFYGPKIDLHMQDSLGRPWQMGTIQLDSQQPGRLNCRYVGADNSEHVPYVVHRALMGSFERFVGILTEHYAGAFPFWLAPVQVRIIPVGESHRDSALALRDRLEGHRVEVDESDDTVGKRIRNAEVEKIPYVVVYGDKESDESLAIREHGGGQTTLSLAEFRAKLATLSPWQAGADKSLTS
jgi:threonyl-tRNA synthetase